MPVDELAELATWFKKNVWELSGDDGSENNYVEQELPHEVESTRNVLDRDSIVTSQHSRKPKTQFDVHYASSREKKEEERFLFAYIVGIDGM